MQNATTTACPGHRTGWTPTRRAGFLAILEDCGDVSAACSACGLSRQSVYKLRRRDPAFARDWDAALTRLQSRQDAEMAGFVAELRRRAGERENRSWTPSTHQPGVNQPRPC